MDLTRLANLDGVATMPELRGFGFSPRQVQRLASRGQLLRVRPRVYATLGADAEVVRAARVGGRLAGASAASRYGLWTPARQRLIVDVGRAADLRDPRDAALPLDRSDPTVCVLWQRQSDHRRIGVSPLRDVVAQVIRSEAVPIAVAILDSMLRRTALTELDIEAATDALPRTQRLILRRLNRRAESGSESIARTVLEDAGFRVEVQVRVPFTDLDRLDLVVNGRVVVECDSRHHDDPASRTRDAARDLALTALGFVVLRPRWETIMFDPDALIAAVTTLSRRFDLRYSVAI